MANIKGILGRIPPTAALSAALLAVLIFPSCAVEEQAVHDLPESEHGEDGGTDIVDVSGLTDEEYNEMFGLREIDKYTVVDIGRFHDGIARFTVYVYDEGYYSTKAANEGFYDGYLLYGYMDIDGNVVIEPIYREAPEIIDGVAYVETYDGVNEYTRYIINARGESVVPDFHETAVRRGTPSEGMIWVETVEKKLSGNEYTMSYYNEDGLAFEIVNAEPHSFGYEALDFHDGLACLEEDGIFRLVDKDGNILCFSIEGFDDMFGYRRGYVYSYYDVGVREFCGDLAEVYIYRKDQNNHISHQFAYAEIDFDNYLINKISLQEYNERKSSLEKAAPEKNAVRVLESLTNADIISCEMSFSEVDRTDIAVMRVMNKNYETFYTVLDYTNRKLLLEPTQSVILWNEKTKSALEFHDGVCKAFDPDSRLYGYIDVYGNWVIEPQYEKATDFSDGYAVVNGTTVINKENAVVFEIF